MPLDQSQTGQPKQIQCKRWPLSRDRLGQAHSYVLVALVTCFTSGGAFLLLGVPRDHGVDDNTDKQVRLPLDQQEDSENQSEGPVVPRDSLPKLIPIDRVPPGFEALPPAPNSNPTTPEKAALGRRLFFDTILSTDRSVSCASCHQPEHGFASPDALAIGIGGKLGRRNAPSILNRVFGSAHSWDGRDESLEKQALGPLTSKTELGGDLETVLKNLKSDEQYVADFAAVFGGGAGAISIDNVAKAIACFERTLVSGNSGLDRFRGSEYVALSKAARQGMWIFESRGRCWKCHSGANLTDEDFHNTGVGFGQENRDPGRFEATADDAHRFQFKTPSLRDVELTAPYMHDGSQKTLREVVEFYNKGGAPNDERLDQEMKPLNLSEEEIGFLVEFLKALTGDGLAPKG